MTRIPKYRHHKATDQALVEINGQRLYLGRYGTPESQERYERLIAEYLHNGRRVPDWAGQRRTYTNKSAVLVVNVIARYWEHAKQYYVHPDGRSTTSLSDIKQAIRPLRALYGRTPAAEFGPKKLLVVRQSMIDKGWNRSTVNDRIKWVRRMFAWATENELVPGKVWHDLKAVASLRAGRSEAPEPRKVKPVSNDRVEAIKPFVSRQVWALVKLQLLTGARGGELVIMRALDIDMSAEVWLYHPSSHKTAYRGAERIIYIGPEAQEIIKSFLPNRPVHQCLFSPKEAEEERREQIHRARTTPASYGNAPGTNRTSNPKRPPAEHYTTTSYARAIQRACDEAFEPPTTLKRQRIRGKRGERWETIREWHARLGKDGVAELRAWRKWSRWHPHQLRHSAGTLLRAKFGIEAARLILGHNAPSVTETYAERDHKTAMDYISQIG